MNGVSVPLFSGVFKLLEREHGNRTMNVESFELIRWWIEEIEQMYVASEKYVPPKRKAKSKSKVKE